MPDEEYTWPKKGMKAFVKSGDWKRDVNLDWGKDNIENYYIEGFKLGADSIVDAAGADPGHPDKYFYPAALCYRHFIELSLKRLVSIASELVKDEPLLLVGHPLWPLWKKLRPMLEQVWPSADTEPLEAVEKIIQEFHSIDKSGQEFRYAVKKSGKESLKNAPRWLSLKNLKATMKAVSAFCSGCYYGMAQELELKRDMERTIGRGRGF